MTESARLHAAEVDPPRRPSTTPCTSCSATASGCRSVTWLRGRPCCESCHHPDTYPPRTTATGPTPTEGD